MFKKLCFLLITVILLAGCGASAPAMDRAESDRSDMLQAPAGGTETDTAPAESVYGLPADLPEETEPAACDAEYFIFSKTTNTVTDEAGQPLLIENRSLPQFSSMDRERSEWVSGILEEIDRDYAANSRNLIAYAQDFITMHGIESFYSYSNYQQLGIARHDDKVVSLLSLSSLNSGGSHPNSVQTAYNLDIANQRVLRLEDLIAEDRATALAQLVRARVDETFNGMGLFEDYAATIDSSMLYGSMTPYWYLNDTGLVIFYNQYELGPYAAGIIKAELPYETLDGILLEEYYPIPSSGIPGDLLLRSDWPGYHDIPVTIEPEGERLLVGVEGKVYQVQISEVSFVDGTPVSQELIFSARTLCQNDVLQITGGFDDEDENRSFAIKFFDGLGQHHIYYLHVGALSEEP